MEVLRNKKHIFFDLDDTLWDFGKNSSEVLADLFDEFELRQKLNTGKEQFLDAYRILNLQLWSLYYKKQIDKNDLRNDRFHKVFKSFGYDNYEENLKISEKYMQRARYGKALKEGCLETLQYLKEKYALHIITNGFAESQTIKIDGCGLRPYFKNIIISDEYALIKPEEKIFRLAENLSQAKPSECVMIGDSLESDVAGALNAGWTAIYFAENNIHEYAGHSIKKLSELQKFL